MNNEKELAILGSERIESTDGSLSQYHGPEVVLESDHIEERDLKLCTLDGDTVEWFSRDFLLTRQKLGMTSGVNEILINPYSVLSQPNPTAFRNKYRFMSWKSIKIRVTCSDPKACTGFYSVVCVPFNKSVPNTYTQGNLYGPYIDSMWSMPLHSYCKSFGAPGDIEFDFPWSFRTPMMSITEIGSMSDTRPGVPILQVAVRDQHYVGTSVADPYFQIFVKFEGIKFYCPIYSAQSGVLAGVAAPIIADLATHGIRYAADAIFDRYGMKMEATTNIFSENLKKQAGKFSSAQFGNDYSKPVDITPSIIGDTISEEVSWNLPIRGKMNDFVMHPQRPIEDVELMHFLSRPQHIGTFNQDALNPYEFTNFIFTFRPNGLLADLGTNWFTFFSRLARYWSGDLYLDVLVHGHATVESRLTVTTLYRNIFGAAPLDPASSASFGSIKTDDYVFQGPKTFSFLMPFASALEYMPVIPNSGYWNTKLSIKLETLSSLVNPAPVLSFSVFVRAAPNFKFYDPVSPSGSAIYAQTTIYPAPSEINGLESELKRGGVLKPLSSFRDALGLWSGVNFSEDDESVSGYYPALPMAPSLGRMDFVAYLTQLYLLRKGGLSHKVICGQKAGRSLAGVALAGRTGQLTSVIPTSIPVTQEPPIPVFLDPGKGAVFTDSRSQPMITYDVPYRGSNSFGYCAEANDTLTFSGDESDPVLDSNFEFIRKDVNGLFLTDKLIRKVAHDFSMAVEVLPQPPIYWAQQ